ncbi:vicilin Cor a 11.0101 [Ricinus communis]|uniref:Nucleolar protein nop56, putative n=1 Tax=Ricinus communis TaxID=3988 RepID=B9SFI3_RICCO|nr:vicilin Cor a 11.0101 [Ricinus communis]EEF37595.1 nucleolar protein nop56, putative [Ricinus communis]|eukprot:XP_002524752.1 vicilin-like antimicrobial peptides 2-2 [Ricinus communis]
MKLSIISVLFVFVLFTGTLAQATTDPELKQCKHQCKVQRQYGEDQKRQCMRRCEEYYREKERERERREGEGEGEGEGGGRGSGHREEDDWDVSSTTDPEKRLRECQRQCERQEGQQRTLCRRRCQESYEREREREEEGGRGEREHGREKGGGRGGKEEETNEEAEENPYVFDTDQFTEKVRTEHGSISVLPRFTKKSKLLRGIENYRVGILKANPQTFVAPSHWDADAVLVVAKGRGTVTLIHEEGEKRSFNIEVGDVMRVRAGTPVYVINRDDNEKLYIINFIQPVNLPGEFEAFRAAGGREDESFYNAFSWELLEAAFKTDRRRIEQLITQKQEAIVKASKEQIQAMTHRDQEGGTIWPFGGESSGAPFNLLHKRPVQSNNHGQLFEARPNDHKEQLQDLDLMISFANITRGSMAGPLYNSRATKIAIVTQGEGYMEMACPHLSGGSEHQGRKGQTYGRVRSRLRPGTVFIVPAGHPVATVASPNNNLAVLCFEVNAQGNIRYTLAGRNNIVRRWEREAKELAFGVRAREVDEVFESQNEVFFFPGPRRQEWQGRASA